MPETPRHRRGCRKLRQNDLHSTQNNIVLYKQPDRLVRRTRSNFVQVAPLRQCLPLSYYPYTINMIMNPQPLAHTIFVGVRFLSRMTMRDQSTLPSKPKSILSPIKAFASKLKRRNYSRFSTLGSTTLPSGSTTTKNNWRSGPLIPFGVRPTF
jgi:hypothetical protein